MASEPQHPPGLPFELRGCGSNLTRTRWPSSANQLAVQVAQGNVVLTFGRLTGPILSGTPEEQRERLNELGPTPIRMISQLVVPFAAFRDMVGAPTDRSRRSTPSNRHRLEQRNDRWQRGDRGCSRADNRPDAGTSNVVGFAVMGSFASHAEVTAIRQLDPVVETIAFSMAHIPLPQTGQDDRPGLDIEVGYDDGFVTATDVATGIFGAGETLASAFADLGQALVEHLDVLERQPASR